MLKQPSCVHVQELCTLLRAAHTLVAQPWTFLSKLAKVSESAFPGHAMQRAVKAEQLGPND